MALQVMHRQHRHIQRHTKGFGHAGTHQQRTSQPRPGRIGHRVDVAHRKASHFERLAQEQRQAPDVIAGGELRHHSTVGGVQVDLGVETMAKQAPAGLVDGHAGLVAGGFQCPERA